MRCARDSIRSDTLVANPAETSGYDDISGISGVYERAVQCSAVQRSVVRVIRRVYTYLCIRM